MPQNDSVPVFKVVLLISSRICLIVSPLSTCFVLFQTVPVLVTRGRWEEEVFRTIIAYETIGFVASVYVYLGYTELHHTAYSPFSLQPQCGNRLSKCCLLFVLSFHMQLCWALSFNQHTVDQIPYWSNVVIRSQAVLARNESLWQAFRCTCLACISLCFQDYSSKEELCVVSPCFEIYQSCKH